MVPQLARGAAAVIRFTRGFPWLARALETDHETVPRVLADRVQVTADGDQDGWGHADTTIAPFSYTVSGGPQVVDLITGDAASAHVASPERQIVVMALSVAGGAAVPADCILQYRPGPSGTPVIHTCVTVGSSQELFYGQALFDAPLANSRAWLPNGHLWVPRGYRPQLVCQSAGDLLVSGSYAIMKAGFRAGAP